ncbi:hypothetical protein [Deinococcus apachensis]|uniref:hypothetical protein n=1 Tax=Deinococcus apachensis TaxID=309886 RepID=UPI0012FA6A87|nr:hypothetical protein [Deinococcus apachensis]
MLDVFGGDEHHEQHSPFFPFVNSEQVRLLATAVLYSRAADYKQPREPYDYQQYARTHNALTNVLGSGDISAVSTPEELEIKFFAPVANRQFPAQTSGEILSRLARNYALMAVIPREHSAEIQQAVNNAGLSFDMNAELQHTYGLSLERFLQLAFSVVALYLQRNESVGVNEKAKARVRFTRAPLPVLEAYLRETQRRRLEVQFVPPDLAVVASSTEIEGFLRLTANTTRELRGALARPEYQRGSISLRVTPLARELKEAAKVVSGLEPELQVAVATYLKAATGSDRPSTSQVRAAAEVAAAIDAHGTVAHPDTGAEVPFSALTGEQRAAALAENVTTGTHERMQRQQQHIQESLQANASTGRGGWADWCMTYAQQHLTDDQELVIRVFRDESGNPQAQALVRNVSSGNTLVFGERAPYLKKAVLNLVEEVKG